MSSSEDVSSSDGVRPSPTDRAPDIISIVIKRPREDNNGNNFECTVSKRSTVGELKELLEQKHPAHPAQQIQQLIYGGRILQDPEPIEYIISSSMYQVTEAIKPVLYLVLKGEGSTKAENNVGTLPSLSGNHVAEAVTESSNMSRVPETHSSAQSTEYTSPANAVTETLELQRMLQSYFSQLEASLRDWSRHLEQLANISGSIARGSSSSGYTGVGNGVDVPAGHRGGSETMQRAEATTDTQQEANLQGTHRNSLHDARRPELGRQQAEVAAPIFQRGFVLQFQVDWHLLMKLIFLVLLLGQDGDPFRFYALLCFAALVYLYQTGALSGIVTRISSLVNTYFISRPSNVSQTSNQVESYPESRSSRIRQTIRSIYLKIYIFLYSFICSLFPAWQPAAAERPPQHED